MENRIPGDIGNVGMPQHRHTQQRPRPADPSHDSRATRASGSDRVRFFDSEGTDLQVGDFDAQSDGNALGTFGDDTSALVMSLARPVRSLSLAFGNDDPDWSCEGDRAVLTLFLKDRRIARTSVVMNRDDLMNQRIEISGHPFDRAVFFFDVCSPNPQGASGLIEIVDDLTVGI